MPAMSHPVQLQPIDTSHDSPSTSVWGLPLTEHTQTEHTWTPHPLTAYYKGAHIQEPYIKGAQLQETHLQEAHLQPEHPQGAQFKTIPVLIKRLKRRPEKVWVKGKRGFRLGRRKTAVRPKQWMVRLQKNSKDKTKMSSPGEEKKMNKAENEIKLPARLNIPTKQEKKNIFVDFGNDWRHSTDYGTSSVKVKRKKDPKSDRKGKKMKKSKKKSGEGKKIRRAKSYRMKTEDGSIKWGYVSTDGSYKVILSLIITILTE